MATFPQPALKVAVPQRGYSDKKIVAWLLLLTGCFNLKLFSHQGFTYLFFAILAFFVIKYWTCQVVDKKWFVVFGLSIIISCLYSALFNKQDPIRTLVNSYTYLGIFSIFLLYHFSPTYKQADRAILILSIIWSLCYLGQWIIYPVTLFVSAADEVTVNDTYFRMRLPGSICAYCLFLYGINRLITTKSIYYIGYSLLGIVPIFIMGFRSLTTAVVVCAFIMIGIISKNFWRTVLWTAIAAVLGVFALDIPIIGDKIEEMMERQESDQTFDNADYIRYIEYDYFTQDFFTKPGEKFFGGGVPVNGKSDYAKRLLMAEERFSFYWYDLGVVGLSWIIGVPAVITLLIILGRGAYRCRAPENQYIRFTIIAVTLASVFTSMEIYRDGNLLIVGLLLYTIDAFNREQASSDPDSITLNQKANGKKIIRLPRRICAQG